MKTLHRSTGRSGSDDYLELIKAFPLRAIRSRSEFDAAIKVLGRLLGRANSRLTGGEQDYADVLGKLIDEYGAKAYPQLEPAMPPLEVLRFLMLENGMNTEGLGNILGNKTAASLVLNGKRELSKAHIRRLAAFFKVDAGLFFA